MMRTISEFSGKFGFLSNFFPSMILIRGRRWPTVEHAFQAAKTLDRGQQEMVRAATSAKLARRLGRTVDLRPGWEERKLRIMWKLVTMKFEQNHKLWCLLEDTRGRALIEGNHWHDNFWGNCICAGCGHISGQNHLGQILMQVRSELSVMGI